MKRSLNELPVYQKQGLVQRYAYKRYAKMRWNFFVSFIIIIVLFSQFKLSHFSFTNILSDVVGIGLILQFLVSIPTQVFMYYVKLPTKHYKVKLTNKDINILKLQMILTIINLALLILNLNGINIYALIMYILIIIALTSWNYFVITWIKNKLILGKDKYFMVIKNIYMSLSKSDRKF